MSQPSPRLNVLIYIKKISEKICEWQRLLLFKEQALLFLPVWGCYKEQRRFRYNEFAKLFSENGNNRSASASLKSREHYSQKGDDTKWQ